MTKPVVSKSEGIQFFKPIYGTGGEGGTYLAGKLIPVRGKKTVFRVEFDFPRTVPKTTEIRLPIPKVEQIGIDQGVWCEQCHACWQSVAHAGNIAEVIHHLLIWDWFLSDGGNKWTCPDCLDPKRKSRRG